VIIVGCGNYKDNNDDSSGGSWARGGTIMAISGSQVAVIGVRDCDGRGDDIVCGSWRNVRFNYVRISWNWTLELWFQL